MKCAYEAANAVEAHMIANLLEQHSIESRIDGEYLAGAIGELPAAGLVRVMVDEMNHDRARQVIRDWEAASPPVSSDASVRTRTPLWFFLGVATTVLVMSWVYRSKATADGVDFNGDGRFDETYSYDNGALRRVDGDANLDGRVDYVRRYNDRGRPDFAEVDLNFDGRFELKQTYERNYAKRVDIDWDLDGRIDRREDYTNGVLASVTHYAAAGGGIVKRERYQAGVLMAADYDADGDGAFDTAYTYDLFGEVIEAVRR
jgi:hypothetical protein